MNLEKITSKLIDACLSNEYKRLFNKFRKFTVVILNKGEKLVHDDDRWIQLGNDIEEGNFYYLGYLIHNVCVVRNKYWYNYRYQKYLSSIINDLHILEKHIIQKKFEFVNVNYSWLSVTRANHFWFNVFWYLKSGHIGNVYILAPTLSIILFWLILIIAFPIFPVIVILIAKILYQFFFCGNQEFSFKDFLNGYCIIFAASIAFVSFVPKLRMSFVSYLKEKKIKEDTGDFYPHLKKILEERKNQMKIRI